jgi:hypothetical protein
VEELLSLYVRREGRGSVSDDGGQQLVKQHRQWNETLFYLKNNLHRIRFEERWCSIWHLRMAAEVVQRSEHDNNGGSGE